MLRWSTTHPDPFRVWVSTDPRMDWMILSRAVGMSSAVRRGSMALHFLKSVGWWGVACEIECLSIDGI